MYGLSEQKVQNEGSWGVASRKGVGLPTVVYSKAFGHSGHTWLGSRTNKFRVASSVLRLRLLQPFLLREAPPIVPSYACEAEAVPYLSPNNTIQQLNLGGVVEICQQTKSTHHGARTKDREFQAGTCRHASPASQLCHGGFASMNCWKLPQLQVIGRCIGSAFLPRRCIDPKANSSRMTGGLAMHGLGPAQ